MDIFLQTTSINDKIFEREYFHKFKNEISSWPEFQEIEKYITKTDFHIKFSYACDKSWGTICYFIEFGIYDKYNNLLHVPQTPDSVFFERIVALSASASALFYNTMTKKTKEQLDSNEMKADCRAIIEYLRSLDL